MSLAKLHFLVKKVLKKGSGVHVLRAPKNPILGPKWEPKSALLGSFLRSFFGACFGPLLDHFWAPFWGPFWRLMGPRRPQDVAKRTIKSFEDPKSDISKNLKKPPFFIGFWDPEASQESLKRPKKAPRRSRESSKTFKKRSPKIDLKKVEFWSGLGSVLGAILEPKNGPKRSQKRDPKNDPKNDPKRVAPVRPRRPKIVPSRAVLGPFPPRSYTPNRTCTPKNFPMPYLLDT